VSQDKEKPPGKKKALNWLIHSPLTDLESGFLIGWHPTFQISLICVSRQIPLLLLRFPVIYTLYQGTRNVRFSCLQVIDSSLWRSSAVLLPLIRRMSFDRISLLPIFFCGTDWRFCSNSMLRYYAFPGFSLSFKDFPGISCKRSVFQFLLECPSMSFIFPST
jgi:hypothetical protein